MKENDSDRKSGRKRMHMHTHTHTTDKICAGEIKKEHNK